MMITRQLNFVPSFDFILSRAEVTPLSAAAAADPNSGNSPSTSGIQN